MNANALFPIDDVESLAYSIAWIYKGKLPWEHVLATEEDTKQLKHMFPKNVLQDMPPILTDFFSYANALNFRSEVEYIKWIDLFSINLSSSQ